MLTETVAGTITCIPNAAMNYRNYKRSIQAKHGVQLIGWPSSCPFKNPSQISTISSLKAIRNAVSAGVCAWKRMSEAEIAAINVELEKKAETKTKKPCKVRAKNKNTTKHKASKTAQVEHSDESGDEENGRKDQQTKIPKRKKGGAATDNNDSEDDTPPAKKKKPARKQPQNKGKAAVTTLHKRSVAQKIPPGPTSKEFINTSEDDSD
jgi:hypothetical protein